LNKTKIQTNFYSNFYSSRSKCT